MTLTQITEKGIKDGEIINADINASAAIAGTKISPTFTSNVTIQNTSPILRLEDSNNNSDFELMNVDGVFSIKDATNSAVRMTINSSGKAVYQLPNGNTDGFDIVGGSSQGRTNLTVKAGNASS